MHKPLKTLELPICCQPLAMCLYMRSNTWLSTVFNTRRLYIWLFVSKQDKMKPQGKCSAVSRNSVRRKTSRRTSRSVNTSKNRPNENDVHAAKRNLADIVNCTSRNSNELALETYISLIYIGDTLRLCRRFLIFKMCDSSSQRGRLQKRLLNATNNWSSPQ